MLDMKKLSAFALLLSLVFSGMAQEPKSYRFSLEDCIRFAFANSNERKSMERAVETTTFAECKCFIWREFLEQ